MSSDSYLVVIAGPTAVGKTALSIALAKYFKTEILSADSRQCYRQMNIGTAKPTQEELASVPHHFINSLDISEEYNAGRFEKDVLNLLQNLFQKHRMVFLAGGSGMYVRAVTDGFDDLPESRPEIRIALDELFRSSGISALQELLKEKDIEYYQKVDLNNPQRLMRALEVIEMTGKTYSELRIKKYPERPFKIIKIGLDLPRETLYQRIDERMDQMLKDGLLEEVRGLISWKDKNALQTVGYSEIFDFLDGKYPWEEAVRLLKRNSRRYAKRQLTWFGQDPSYQWFSPSAFDEIKSYIMSQTDAP